MHSHFSDGQLSPQELVAACANNQITAISVTDHDSIASFPEVKKACELHKLEWIPGVEFTCHDAKGEFHMLAYLWEEGCPELENLLIRYKTFREERALKILDGLKKKGHHITMDEVREFSHSSNIGRPHIAMVLVKKNIVPDFESAFVDLLSADSTKNLTEQKFSPEEVLATVKAARGITGIAHPHKVNRDSEIGRLAQMGMDGMETYFSQGSPFQTRKYKEMAKSYGLLKMGGSDFHNHRRGTPGKPKVPYSVLDKLKERQQQKFS